MEAFIPGAEKIGAGDISHLREQLSSGVKAMLSLVGKVAVICKSLLFVIDVCDMSRG